VAEATLPGVRIRVGIRPVLIGVAVLAVGISASYWFVALRGHERTDDAFVEGHLVFLSPRVGGHVLEVLVDENERVSANQPLVRLDRADFEVRVAQARADLDAARNRMAQVGAAAEAAEAQGRAAAVRLRHAEQELARARELVDKRAAAITSLDTAIAARDAAAAELRAAEQSEQAERAALGSAAPVRQAEAALQEAELSLAYTVLTAPFDGVVGKKGVEAGANVAAGQPLVALAAATDNWVIANFKETQIGRMKPGDRAEIRVDAFPDRRWRGHVESISPATGAKYALLPPDNATGNFTKVVQRVPVKIAIDGIEPDGEPEGTTGADATLPVGLSVNVDVRVR
jgi:membrane fusion protein (multidrug efflux system)